MHFPYSFSKISLRLSRCIETPIQNTSSQTKALYPRTKYEVDNNATQNQDLKEDHAEKFLTGNIFMGRFLKLLDDILELYIAVQNVGS